MLERIIDRNISFLQKHTPCNEEQVTVYKYALQILYTYLIDVIILFLISSFFGRLYETIIMTLIFAVLQVIGGGYHADTKLRCFLTMTAGCAVGHILIYIFSIYIVEMVIASVGMGIIIFPLLPVVNQNHPVTKRVYRRSKCVSRIVVLVILLSILILSMFGRQTEASVITITLFLYTLSLIAAIKKSKSLKNVK